MRKTVSLITASLIVLLFTVMPLSAQSPQREQEQTKWIEDSLIEMKTIKVGMTRADLLKVFDTEGGLSTGLNRTYVYRKCPLIKVDVEFQPVGRPARDAKGRVTLKEADEDVIEKISRPYLDWTVMD
ncbi:MAG TPA: hypothetical protein VF779_19910 [Pyrinomonadaceae bacterium]